MSGSGTFQNSAPFVIAVNGGYNALTPPTLVIAGLRGAIAQEVPALSFVFDPELDWPSTAADQREMRDMEEGSGESASLPGQIPYLPTSQFPIMAWRRSVLRPQEDRLRRAVFQGITTIDVSGGDWSLQFVNGEIRFDFRFFARDVLELEALEMGYATKTLISNITGFFIPVASLYPALDVNSVPPSVWKYDVQWDPLEEISTQKKPSMIFAVKGSCLIRGAFVSGLMEPHFPVRTIDTSIMSFDHQLDLEIIVTKSGP